jgi:hypothetical protein
MQRKHWIWILIVGLFLCACLFLATCGITGFLLGRSSWSSTTWQPSVELPPAPTAVLLEASPGDLEYETVRSLTETDLPPRDLVELARQLQGLSPALATPSPQIPPDYDVGDATIFWVHDVTANAYYTTTAILGYETDHAYWWIEEGYSIPARDLESSARAFEEKTYPRTRELFGSEWYPGIDQDPHVYLFLGNVVGVGGYFSGPDEYPKAVRPESNEHEMFYINLENAGPGNSYFDGILAHEFQHMIHWAQDRNETSWVNEGLSELAAFVNGYDVGGSDYVFTQAPDTQLTTWPELEDSGPHYGASFLFLAYFMERYGEDAIPELVREPANGIAGFEILLDRLDPGVSFDDLFADWLVANYLDDPRVADGRYAYRDLRLDPLALAAEHGTYPVAQEATVRQYAADYILLEGSGDLTVEFQGNQVVPLLGNRTHSGAYQWWSNRGDDGDATLTRAFDLTGLDSATLEAWMWYDLEVDYDYAYVQVSTDGGDTWQILENDNTTTYNPSGNGYGPAFTGTSGGGSAPSWSLERFDLSPYAGQPVWVRFQVITDEAVNRPGLAVDDLAIPELGYGDDVESGDGGWQAQGWVRVTDHVPQGYRVQVIAVGDDTQLLPMPLDEENRGALTIAGLGRETDYAVLVVSAVAPVTTEWASYRYTINRD